MPLEPGQIIDGKYRIVRTIGTGGMGAVYEGENVRIRRRVAIKVLHRHVSTHIESVARFEREAQAAGRISSDHICEVLDLGVLEDGTRFMVLEYLDGETLTSRIKRCGRLAPEQVGPIMVQVLEGLGAAHSVGIIHRDLKPDNIFILPNKGGRPDFVKLLDFGVSKFGQSDDMSMTRTGSIVGTPYYMSPEQARGTPQVDARTDIYALGVLLYQAMTGRVPFQASSFNELLFKIALEQPPPPTTHVPDLDPHFVAIIERAMAREPVHRFQSCTEFREVLMAWLTARAAAGPLSMSVATQLAAIGAAQGPILTPHGLPAAPMTTPHGLAQLPMMTPHSGVPITTPHGLSPAPMGSPSSHQLSSGTPVSIGTGRPTPELGSSGAADGQLPTANSWGHSGEATTPKGGHGLMALGAVTLLIAGGATAYLLLSPRRLATSAPGGAESPAAAPPVAASASTAPEPPSAAPSPAIAASGGEPEATSASTTTSPGTAAPRLTHPARPTRTPSSQGPKPPSMKPSDDLGY